ncbi:MAG: hypothetical protein JST82_00855 [Bacteroidetes bacterium]|nr:hypothetical protein [Bacteroidota bacterium]
MTPEEEKKIHKQLIDISIKSHIQSLMTTGDIDEADFYTNADGDKMINITDQAGDVIVFNYTKGTIYSYAGRLND